MWLPLLSKWGMSRRKGLVARRRSSAITIRLEALEDRLLPSGTPQLLKDIKSAVFIDNGFGGASPLPNSFVEVKGALFFAAEDRTHGLELWRTDGSTAGTQMVKDIFPGIYGSQPYSLVNVGGTVFFSANDGTHGSELWRSDGSAAGTQMVKDIDPGSSSSSPFELTNVGGTLFFSADDGTHGYELWRSDGSAAGTHPFQDNFGSSPSDPYALTNLGRTLLFTAYNGELWRSDGTAAGTHVVTDNIGVQIGLDFQRANVGGTLFFGANDDTHGTELWRSDGTAAGTHMVKDVNPGLLTNVAGTLFFEASDGVHGIGLWRSDGTAAGTHMVKDLGQGNPPYGVSYLTNVSGTLFFAAYDGNQNYGLWRSDGTSAGTQMVKDINLRAPSFPNDPPYRFSSLTNVGGTVFFRANDGRPGDGFELWRSDGTTAGTQMVKDSGGSGLYYPLFLTNIRGTLFFSADDGVQGETPWILPVAPAPATHTSLNATPSGNRFFGSAITLTAHVSTTGPGSFAGTTGTVDFKDGTTTLASNVPLTHLTATGGTATFVIASGNTLAAGTHHFSAVYGGDNNFQPSTSSAQDITIAPAVAQTTISLSAPNDTNGNGKSVYGQGWAVTATVRAAAGFGSGTPTGGKVVFTDTIVTNASRTGTFLLGGETTMTLGSAPVGAGGVAVWSEGLAAGRVLPGAITAFLTDGTKANISPVTHVIKAQYLGNADFTASTSSTGKGEIISRDTTETVIKSATPNSAQFGQVVTMTAIVRTLGALIGPLGNVTFTDSYMKGGVTIHCTLGTAKVSPVTPGETQAMATFTTALLAQAAHALQAIYNGDTAAPFPLPTSGTRAEWLPSTSAVYGLVVRGAAQQLRALAPTPSLLPPPLSPQTRARGDASPAVQPAGQVVFVGELNYTDAPVSSSVPGDKVPSAPTSSRTTRTLAGALTKARPGDDWPDSQEMG
jgi:ELWxxDGT repeat protein